MLICRDYELPAKIYIAFYIFTYISILKQPTGWNDYILINKMSLMALKYLFNLRCVKFVKIVKKTH